MLTKEQVWNETTALLSGPTSVDELEKITLPAKQTITDTHVEWAWNQLNAASAFGLSVNQQMRAMLAIMLTIGYRLGKAETLEDMFKEPK